MSRAVVRDTVFVTRLCRIVDQPWQALGNQLIGPDVSRVTVKRTGTTVFLNRRSGDLITFHQIIGQGMYHPPPIVLDLLRKGPSAPRIADLGANIGLFTVSALEHFPDATILAIEADDANAAIFEKTIEANEWQDQIELIRAAAGNTGEPVSFTSGELFQSRVELAEEPGHGVDVVAGVDVLPRLVDVDLAKIDIEGSEWAILQDPRFASLNVRALAMEWHQYGCPDDDAPSYVEGILKDAGFEVEHDLIVAKTCGTLWAWRS